MEIFFQVTSLDLRVHSLSKVPEEIAKPEELKSTGTCHWYNMCKLYIYVTLKNCRNNKTTRPFLFYKIFNI